jgi:hypothetical protein
MKMHKRITHHRVLDACIRRNSANLDDPGFCIECGHEQGGCKPDSRELECEACGEKKVYGVEEILIHLT